MALTNLHVENVCCAFNWWGQSNKGKVCKYLDGRSRSDGTFVNVCTKLNSSAYAKLQKKRNSDDLEFGDNCPGYLMLLYKKQGYDV